MPQKEIAQATQCEIGLMQINKCLSLINGIRKKRQLSCCSESYLSISSGREGTGLETKIYIDLSNSVHPKHYHCQKGLLRSTKLLVLWRRNREAERESDTKEHSY